jgi:hypothetical protein
MNKRRLSGYLLKKMVKSTIMAITMMQPTIIENQRLGGFSCGSVCFWLMMFSLLCVCSPNGPLDILHQLKAFGGCYLV